MKIGGSSTTEDGDREDSSGEGEDRLSSLPEVLLVGILSLLTIKTAIATSVLSRRWRHLWTQLTHLHFWGRLDHNDEIGTIIDHIFRHLNSPKIHSFRLDQTNCSSYLPSWIRQLCRRNVEEITISFYKHFELTWSGSDDDDDDDDDVITVPACLFETQSLVSLQLDGRFDYKLPNEDVISLPNLKRLNMNFDDRNRKLMKLLFKSCPLLEYLWLYVDWEELDHFVDITAHNLEHLTIEMKSSVGGSQFRIDAPKLEGFFVESHTIAVPSFCFVRPLKGLCNATIWVDRNGEHEYSYLKEMSEIVQGISSARSLDLSFCKVDFLHDIHDGGVPVFQNLTHLCMKVIHPHGWNSLMRLLQCSPNLEVLVADHGYDIDYHMESMDWTIPNSVLVCLSKKLKRMEIKGLQGCQKELDFLGYILSNASVLERLLLCDFNFILKIGLCEELEYCENLFSYPRSSIACEIEVSSRFLSASSKGSNKGSLDCRIHYPVRVCHP